jgi:hypothetical protein
LPHVPVAGGAGVKEQRCSVADIDVVEAYALALDDRHGSGGIAGMRPSVHKVLRVLGVWNSNVTSFADNRGKVS